jgi:hypothetical protein
MIGILGRGWHFRLCCHRSALWIVLPQVPRVASESLQTGYYLHNGRGLHS